MKPVHEALVVRPRSHRGAVSRQGSKSVVALTLATMTVLEPRDADVAKRSDVPSVPESEETVLSRSYRALSIGIVSVVLLIAFEATAVGTAMPVAARELDGVSLYAFAFSGYFTTSLFGMVLAGQWSDRRGPLGALTAGHRLLRGRAAAGRDRRGDVAVHSRAGRAGARRRSGDRRPVRGRRAGLPRAAAAGDHGGVRGGLGRAVDRGAAGLRGGDRASGLAVGVRRDSGARRVPARARAAADTAAGGGPVDDSARVASFDRRRIRLALGISLGAGLLQYAAQDLRWLSLVPGVVGAALLVPAVLGLLPRGTYRAVRGLPSVVLLRGVAAGSFIAAESFVPLMLVTQRGCRRRSPGSRSRRVG